MKTIIAGQKFMDDVVAGKKKQTVRIWKKKSNIIPGEIIHLFNYRKKLPVRILAIYEKMMEELTEEEANDNGYDCLETFKNAIREIYGINPPKMTVIKFQSLR